MKLTSNKVGGKRTRKQSSKTNDENDVEDTNLKDAKQESVGLDDDDGKTDKYRVKVNGIMQFNEKFFDSFQVVTVDKYNYMLNDCLDFGNFFLNTEIDMSPYHF